MALTLLCSALLAVLGCSHGAKTRCGPFVADASVPCPESGYAGIVKTEAGRETRGVYWFHNSGTGVIIDRSGVVVTAAHVVNGKSVVAVFVQGDEAAYAATPIPGYTFEDLDLAFLRIVGEGRRAARGCVFSPSLSRRDFPEATLAGPGAPVPAVGSAVRVVGYPNDKPRVLAGRIIDPRARLALYVEENGLHRYAPPEWTSFRLPPAEPACSETLTVLLDGLRTVATRVSQGFLFVELDSSERQAGISGGAIMLGDKVVGIAIESWNSFDRKILIGVPVQTLASRDPLFELSLSSNP